VTTQEQFLSKRQRYQPIALPQHFSDEEMVRDWTLFPGDIAEIAKYRHNSRLFIAIQLCAVRLYGRFLNHVHELSPHIISFLGQQLALPPSLVVEVPERKATYTEHRYNIMTYLGFQKFDDQAQAQLEAWIEHEAQRGLLPDALFQQVEQHLLAKRVLLPGPSVLERLIIHVCSHVHGKLFETVFSRLSPALRQAIDQLLLVPDGEQHSAFYLHIPRMSATQSMGRLPLSPREGCHVDQGKVATHSRRSLPLSERSDAGRYIVILRSLLLSTSPAVSA